MVVVTFLSVISLVIQRLLQARLVQKEFETFMILSTGIILFLIYLYLKYLYKKREEFSYHFNMDGLSYRSEMVWQRWYLIIVIRNLIKHHFQYLSTLPYIIVNILLISMVILAAKPLLAESHFQFLKSDKHPVLKVFITAAKAFLLMMVLSVLINGITYTIAPDLPQETMNNDLVLQALDADFIRIFIEAVVMAPFLEEIIYRGFFFREIYPYHPKLAYMTTFLVFGFVHIVPELIIGNYIQALLFLPSYGAMGVVFAYFYKKTDCIYTSMSIHFLNNLMAIIFSLWMFRI